MNETERFEAVHKAGVERHARCWIAANVAAVETAREILGVADFTPRDKLLVSAVVLAVLDALAPLTGQPPELIEEGEDDGR